MSKRETGETALSLLEAAKLMATDSVSVHDAEVILAEAIQRCELHANIMRWATEQWEGRQLPGNINRLETYIEREDFEAWRKARGEVGERLVAAEKQNANPSGLA
jgi:hypothetical protein